MYLHRQNEVRNGLPFNPTHFVGRMEEVGGLQLENAPRVAPLGTPDLPTIIPFIDHGYRRSCTLDEPVIALSLYEVVNLATGQLHIQFREKLAQGFLI